MVWGLCPSALELQHQNSDFSMYIPVTALAVSDITFLPPLDDPYAFS